MPVMLSASQLGQIRSDRNGLMPETGIIYRYTLSPDGMGGYGETWPAVGTADCYLWQIARTGDRENITGGQVTAQGDWYIEVPYNTVVTAKDWIEIASRTYQVTFVPNGGSILSGLRVEAIVLNEEQRVK